MTLNKLRREVRRLQQRARRAKVRLNRHRFMLKLEGIDYEMWRVSAAQSRLHWDLYWDSRNAAQELQDAHERLLIKKVAQGA